MTTVSFKVHLTNGPAGKQELRLGEAPPKPIPEGRVPRVSRLMALAIHCDRLVRSGEVRDFAEIARLAGVTRARMSQITNLLNLAPEIQEEILFLPRTREGRDALGESDLRELLGADFEWARQLQKWSSLRP
jgi:hypothetical protein